MHTQPAALPDGDRISSLLASLEQADSVELKLTLPERSQRSTLMALGVDPLGAQIRQVFFLDSPGLDLDRAGLVVRARRVQDRDGDTVVKLRPVDPRQLSDDLRHTRGFSVEVDAMPGAHVCSASLGHSVPNGVVRRATSGREALGVMFSPDQNAFYSEHAPAGLRLDTLTVLGPVFVLKRKLPKKSLGRRLVVELWLYPDGGRVLELSTKCHPKEAFEVALEVRAFLAHHGIEVTGEQLTKTRSALEYFTRELAVADAAPARDGSGKD